ncbi:MAG: hypothetical protein ABJG78_12265 [Cyclobacteriaceae bacterium]
MLTQTVDSGTVESIQIKNRSYVEQNNIGQYQGRLLGVIIIIGMAFGSLILSHVRWT